MTLPTIRTTRHDDSAGGVRVDVDVIGACVRCGRQGYVPTRTGGPLDIFAAMGFVVCAPCRYIVLAFKRRGGANNGRTT